KDAQKIQVLIMNEDLSTNYNYTVRLNTAGVTGNNPLKINIDAGLAKEYTESIPSQSTVLLTFNASGVIISKTEYSLMEHAASDLAPTVTTFNATTGVESVGGVGTFEMKIFPNPTAGKLTLKLNTAASDEKSFQIQLFNLVGQEVLSRKSEFHEGKQEIELDPSIANGIYVVRVKEGQKDNYLTEKIVVQK
ncbi:MAG: T9SS type A sorting domain-containing protein, partial [Bacteroidia bacterium]